MILIDNDHAEMPWRERVHAVVIMCVFDTYEKITVEVQN